MLLVCVYNILVKNEPFDFELYENYFDNCTKTSKQPNKDYNFQLPEVAVAFSPSTSTTTLVRYSIPGVPYNFFDTNTLPVPLKFHDFTLAHFLEVYFQIHCSAN